MSLLDKLNKKKKDMQEQITRGRIVTEQMRAERLRKKQDKLVNMKPGAKRTLLLGLKNRTGVWDLMKEEYNRRKYEREKKYGKK